MNNELGYEAKSCELEEWGKGASMLDTVQKRGMSSCVVKKDKGDASIHLEWPTKPCECDYTISGHSPFIRLQRFFRASKKQKGCWLTSVQTSKMLELTEN